MGNLKPRPTRHNRERGKVQESVDTCFPGSKQTQICSPGKHGRNYRHTRLHVQQYAHPCAHMHRPWGLFYCSIPYFFEQSSLSKSGAHYSMEDDQQAPRICISSFCDFRHMRPCLVSMWELGICIRVHLFSEKSTPTSEQSLQLLKLLFKNQNLVIRFCNEYA